MKILLVTNSVNGGAGKACRRLFEALRLSGHNAKILHLDGEVDSDDNIVSMYSSVRELFLKQLANIPKIKLAQIRLGTLKTNYRLPYSFHSLEEHPLIEWADVINLHWVPEFLDYPRFFEKVSKPVVWTMHDMLPFSGGYHYLSENKIEKPLVEKRIENSQYSMRNLLSIY